MTNLDNSQCDRQYVLESHNPNSVQKHYNGQYKQREEEFTGLFSKNNNQPVRSEQADMANSLHKVNSEGSSQLQKLMKSWT